jgi:hypothetical protein
MSREIILMLHPMFGVLGVLGSVWVFVDTLNCREENITRIRLASLTVTVLVWLSFLVGGYWYVEYYGVDKAIIKSGPWSFAHGLVMETKEHLFITMLLLSTYLPVAAASRQLSGSQAARNLVLVTTALIVLLGLAMEGAGAIVALGVKLGLMGG